MITITINASTPVEARKNMLELLGLDGSPPMLGRIADEPVVTADTPAAVVVAETPAQPIPEATVDPEPEKAERKPRKKADKPAEPAVETVTITIDDVRAITGRLLNEVGFEKTKGLIESFGAKKAAEIAPEKWAEYVAQATELAAKKSA